MLGIDPCLVASRKDQSLSIRARSLPGVCRRRCATGRDEEYSGEACLLAGVAKLRGRNASAGERLSEPLRAIAEIVLIVPRLHLEPWSQRRFDRDGHRVVGPDDLRPRPF